MCEAEMTADNVSLEEVQEEETTVGSCSSKYYPDCSIRLYPSGSLADSAVCRVEVQGTGRCKAE